MKTRRVKPLAWDRDSASANGYKYAIFSEQPRPEPRFYWPMIEVNGKWRRLNDVGLHVRVEEPYNYGTKPQAKRYAALHAEAVAAALESGEPTP